MNSASHEAIRKSLLGPSCVDSILARVTAAVDVSIDFPLLLENTYSTFYISYILHGTD